MRKHLCTSLIFFCLKSQIVSLQIFDNSNNGSGRLLLLPYYHQIFPQIKRLVVIESDMEFHIDPADLDDQPVKQIRQVN